MLKKIPISENELIRGLQSHDEKTFALLYDNYSPTLLGIIAKIVKDEAEAENLLQDSFVKIWKNIGQYDPTKGHLFTWLLDIARNTALNFLPTPHVFEKGEIQNLESIVYIETVQNELTEVNYIEIGETVQKLAPKLKQVIHLIYFLGYTQQEVSEKLNLPLGTVKTRTHRALQQLRVYFGQHNF